MLIAFDKSEEFFHNTYTDEELVAHLTNLLIEQGVIEKTLFENEKLFSIALMCYYMNRIKNQFEKDAQELYAQHLEENDSIYQECVKLFEKRKQSIAVAKWLSEALELYESMKRLEKMAGERKNSLVDTACMKEYGYSYNKLEKLISSFENVKQWFFNIYYSCEDWSKTLENHQLTFAEERLKALSVNMSCYSDIVIENLTKSLAVFEDKSYITKSLNRTPSDTGQTDFKFSDVIEVLRLGFLGEIDEKYIGLYEQHLKVTEDLQKLVSYEPGPEEKLFAELVEKSRKNR